jgi:phospholipid/cholesterol/gamma-HCH transport system substrate-binding protein
MTWSKSRVVTLLAALIGLGAVVFTIVLVVVGPAQKTLTAWFPEAIHLYPGSNVDILGVQVGQVASVTPMGQQVKVVLSYDATQKLPADVSAVIVTPTLVADRVVQLTPIYRGGPVLADGGSIPLSRDEVPVELDQINASLVKLTNALGPGGVNADGALSRAIRVGDRNLRGQGQHAHQTITQLASMMGTLDDNRTALLSTVNNLQSFTSTLAAHDSQTRAFTVELSRVSGELAGERGAFGAALHNLQIALGEVAGFIHDNRAQLTSDVGDLADVTNVLAKEQVLLAHMVDIGAVGVSNYPHMYTPSQRTYNARFDGNAISDNPALFVCQLLESAGGSNTDCLKLLAPISKQPGSASAVKP